MDSPTSFPSLKPTNADDDTESSRQRNEAIAVATLSIVLYGILAIIAGYYYRKFRNVKGEEKALLQTLSGKYDHVKQLFFAILAISALLDIPTYLGCLANDGPVDCEWKAVDHLFFWFLHLIALCGYAYCIIIPCILWSDMIEKKDGRLFFSEHPYGSVKRYFQILVIAYCLNNVVDIIVSLVYWRDSDRNHYHDAPTYDGTAVVEIVLILLISGGCLYCGINLELYVHEARLNPMVEMKFLFTLNVVLGCIVLSFLGRAVLLLQFTPGMPSSYGLHFDYPIYTLVARWIPDVFCQLALVYIMRISSSEAKEAQQRASGLFRSTLEDASFRHHHHHDEESHVDEMFSESFGSSRVLSMSSAAGFPRTHSSVEDSSQQNKVFFDRSHSNTISVDSTDVPRSKSRQETIDSTNVTPEIENVLLHLRVSANQVVEDSDIVELDRRMLSADYNRTKR